MTGPDDGGGRKGTSIAPDVPLSSWFVPAMTAARVGTDAKLTSSTTMSTYRRVGPENPSAR